MTSILITSAGRRVGLCNAFRDAGRDLREPIRIIAADFRPELSPACKLADVAYPVPSITDPAYIDSVLDICRRESVALVVPTIDPELEPLALSVDRFAAMDVRVQIAPSAFVAMARDKLQTATILSSIGIPVPITKILTDVDKSDIRLPMIAKPRSGSSSVGLAILRSLPELENFGRPAGYIAQELVDGPEYTVNTFYTSDGDFGAAIPHLRIETRAGEMSKGRTEQMQQLTAIAKSFALLPEPPVGAFCFQAIVGPDGPKVIEINARFGGGYPLAHHAGGEFTKWLIEETLGLPTSVNNSWSEGITCLRYDAEVFLP